MANNAAPKLKVVEHRPWQRSILIVAFAVVAIGCLFLGVLLGKQQFVAGLGDGPGAVSASAGSEARIKTLEAQVIDMQLNVEVQNTASNALRSDLTAAHDEAAQLREEVTFYKGLMSPSSVAKGLQIPELELVALDEPGHFKFRLLMTQVALRRSYIAGDVRIDVIGHFAQESTAESNSSEQVVLSLTDLSDLKAYPLKFRFRYFQDLAGNMELPEGFEPERLLVTANESGKTAYQVTFDWGAQLNTQ